MQHSVSSVLKAGVAVSLVDILYEVGRVEQHHQVLGQHSDGVDAQFVLGEQYRSGFRDA
jgi:hypothetical protein